MGSKRDALVDTDTQPDPKKKKLDHLNTLKEASKGNKPGKGKQQDKKPVKPDASSNKS